MLRLERRAGKGWLALLGGGEPGLGDKSEIDRAWLAKISPEGVVGFVPAASGSDEYGRQLIAHLQQAFGRAGEIVPLYRPRDGKRGKNAERILAHEAIYIGGGMAGQLLEAVAGTPCHQALIEKLEQGGVVVAAAAAAQALGQVARGQSGNLLDGLALLPGAAVETGFEPAHERRLRQLMGHPGARWGLGIPAGSAILIGPQGETEIYGTLFKLDSPGGELAVLNPT